MRRRSRLFAGPADKLATGFKAALDQLGKTASVGRE